MSDIPELLDSVEVPLKGFNLIEAAAGTGKTYNIQNLVVRLILENSLKISEIAVLSFTEEAASELSKRIRSVLDNMLAILNEVAVEPDKQAEALLVHDRMVRPEVSDSERKSTLNDAMRDFDLANISTINGFCHKLICRFAFEGKNCFGSILESDPSQYIHKICDDWLREKCYNEESALFFSALLSPENIYKLKSHVLDFNLVLPAADDSFENLKSEVNRLFDLPRTEETFSFIREGVIKAGRTVYTKIERFKKALESRDISAVLELACIYCPENICSSARAGQNDLVSGAVDKEPIFNCCKKIAELKPRSIVSLKVEVINFIRSRFRDLENSINFMTFADQIRLVDEALQNSPDFVNAVRGVLKAGIIDEFQDTDAIQFRIFKAIFQGEDRCSFLVGDPRQAIYRFRGGGTAAYLAAKNWIAVDGNIYRLGVNYRSSVKMVEGVNRIFAVHPHPFGSADIGFPELASRPPEKAPELLYNGSPATEALLRVRVDADDENKLFRMTALRVQQLISDNAPERLPDGSQLRPGDIAILMRKNAQCLNMRRELEKLNIPAVCLKSGNIYVSAEAADLYTVMDAVLNPDDRRKVCTALACALCDMPLTGLRRNEQNLPLLNGYRKLFRDFNSLWYGKGFSAMFEAFLREFHIREKLAVRPDGERALTNLFQLEELIQHEALFERRGPLGLLIYLGDMIAGNRADNDKKEEHEELMSTEGSMVRIMTIHASKGLQFPVVILPGIQKLKADRFQLNDIFYNGSARELNLDDDGEKKNLEKQEVYDELCRLIYVAVTRAEYHCEVFENTQINNTVWTDLMQYCSLPLGEFPDQTVVPYKTESETLKDTVGEFAELYPEWQVISFSSLTNGISAVPQDHDEDEDGNGKGNQGAADAAAEIFSPFALAGGTGFGNLVHECFEQIDFNADRTVFDQAAEFIGGRGELPAEHRQAYLNGYGKWLYDIFHTPLDDFDGGSFTLSEIGGGERISELEFCFGLGRFSIADIRKVAEAYAAAELGAADYPDDWNNLCSGGVLNGFIDLIFRRNGKYYIIDWKTNRLDGRKENFMPENLPAAMIHSLYFLQYLIYMVALVRHLRKFNNGKFGEAEYETMIGGVYYLFVRGISPNVPGRGIFRTRPRWQTISRLEEILCPVTQ